VRRRDRHVAVSAASILIVALLCAPLIILFGVALNAGAQQVFPPRGISLRWFANVFSRSGFLDAIPFSLELAVLTTVVSLTIGTLAAIGIVRFRVPGRDLLLTALMSPLIVPQVVIGLSFLVTFTALGVHSSFAVILILHVTLALPFTVRVIVSSLARFNISIEEAARSLGAYPVKAFVTITLPAIRSGMLAASIFAFVASFENFTATAFLVWNRSTLPVEIFNYIQTENDPTGAAISALVVLTVAFAITISNRVIGLDALSHR